jgi:rhodanese-related sulfurtransferase
MKRKIISNFAFLFLLMMFATLHAEAQTSGSVVKPGEFERLMKKKNTVVIDVRTAEEFQSGHIPGAINMDVKQENFHEQIRSLDKTKKYLLYCRSGKRSETALDIMRSNGFRNILHLKGGIENWKGQIE